MGCSAFFSNDIANEVLLAAENFHKINKSWSVEKNL